MWKKTFKTNDINSKNNSFSPFLFLLFIPPKKRIQKTQSNKKRATDILGYFNAISLPLLDDLLSFWKRFYLYKSVEISKLISSLMTLFFCHVSLIKCDKYFWISLSNVYWKVIIALNGTWFQCFLAFWKKIWKDHLLLKRKKI